MRRVVLDSNAVDPFVDVEGAHETLHAAVGDGRLEILYTHVSIDERSAHPDWDRRATLLAVMADLGHLVPTGAFAVGVSRLGFARLVDDEDVFEALRSGSIDHTRDALIAATAIYEQCALVTFDDRLTRRSRERGIEVLTPHELLTEFGVALTV